MEDKNSFAGRLPFAQRKAYLWWLKSTLAVLGLLVLVLIGISFKAYLNYQDLLIQKNSLVNNVSQLDQFVSKKNKLLAQYNKSGYYSEKNQNIHTKVAGFLIDIEESLAAGVYLSSFEFTANKLELTGYSDSIESLSETIFKLQRLPFVKDHDIEQVTKDVKTASHKLAFTITINL